MNPETRKLIVDLNTVVEGEKQRWLKEVQGRINAFQQKHIAKYPAEKYTMREYRSAKGFYAILPKGMAYTPSKRAVQRSDWPWIECVYPFITESD